MSTLASVWIYDLIANRPAASIPGRIFYASDTSVLYRDNGSSWDTLSLSASLPLTTKGDLLGYTTALARVGVGADGTILTADSSQSAGIKWGAAPATPGMVLLAEATASSSSEIDILTRNGPGQTGNLFQSDYDDYLIRLVNIVPSATSAINIQVHNGSGYDAGANYDVLHWLYRPSGASSTGGGTSQTSFLGITTQLTTTGYSYNAYYYLANPNSTTLYKVFTGAGIGIDATSVMAASGNCTYKQTGAIDGIRVIPGAGGGTTIASGFVRVYGMLH